MGLLCRLFILVAMVTLTSAAPLEEIERVLEDLLLLEELKESRNDRRAIEVPKSMITLLGTKKWCTFKIQDKKVVTDECMPGDENLTDNEDKEAWDRMTKKLLNEPRYILYEINFHNHEGESIRKIIFMFWTPDEASVSNKMIYGSTKDDVVFACTGLKFIFKAHDRDELAYQSIKEEIERKA